MKFRFGYPIYNMLQSFLAGLLGLTLCSFSSAQTKLVGDPATCPLCNPPLEIVQLRGKNYNLHEFPVMHLYEGELASSRHTLNHIEFIPRENPYLMDMSNLNDITRTRLSDYVVDGVFDPYMFIGPYVRIVSQSQPNTLLSAESTWETTAGSRIPANAYVLNIQAGTPGKTAVAWVIGQISKASMLRGTSDSTDLTFIQPVVVHPSPVPLHIQEMTFKADKPNIYIRFNLTQQKPFEKVKVEASQCNIQYSLMPFNPSVRDKPHWIDRFSENCADLVSLYNYHDGKWRLTKRILLILTGESVKEGLNQVSTSYFEQRVFIKPVIKKSPAIADKTLIPGG